MSSEMVRLCGAWTACLLLIVSGCGEWFSNATASLGGDRAGGRGAINLVFINNTPHRAVFTFGTFDRNNPDYQPDSGQFGLEGLTLAANDASAIGSLDCARVFAIGTPELLHLIDRNVQGSVDEAALVEGVAFYADDDPVLLGMAGPFEALLGIDFPCQALLILRLEINDGGGSSYRVDFELIPSESAR